MTCFTASPSLFCIDCQGIELQGFAMPLVSNLKNLARRYLPVKAWLYLHMMKNGFTASGRRKNQRLRSEWSWHIARLKASNANLDLSGTIHGSMTLYFHPNDGVGGKSVFLTGDCEPEASAFMKRFVLPGMVVMDIGGNIGAHTLLLSRCVGNAGYVHVFEPSRAGEYLKRNLETNQIHNVTFNSVAVGNTKGELRLTQCQPGLEAFTSIAVPMWAAAADGYMDARMDSLDNYSATMGIDKIDLVKMDVEGAEVLVLEGARTLVASKSVSAWLFEMNSVCLKNAGYSVEKLETMFVDAGYDLFLLDDEGWPVPYQREKVRKDRLILALLPSTLDQMKHSEGPWGDTFCAHLKVSNGSEGRGEEQFSRSTT